MSVNHRRLLGATLLLASSSPLLGHVPHDVVHTMRVSPSFADDGVVLASVQLTDHWLVARSDDGARTWTVLGPRLARASIREFAYSPAFGSDGVVFAAAADGIHRSADGGFTWARVALAPTHAVVCSETFAVDGTALAGTDGALLRSTDGGLTWAPVETPTPPPFASLARLPGGGVLAGGKTLLRTDDLGDTWSPLGALPRPPAGVAVSPSFATDATVAVALGRAGPPGLMLSTDGGATFTPWVAGLDDPTVVEVEAAPGGRFFAIGDDAACYRADAPFGTWSLHADGFEPLSPQSDWHYATLEVSPAFAADETVFVGGFEGLYRSEDAGESFAQSDLYTARVCRRMSFSPDFANDGRVFCGSYGVHSLYSGSLSVSPTYAVDRTLFYGYYGAWRSTNSGRSWVELFGGPAITRGSRMSPDFAFDGTVILNRSSAGTFLSTDGGDAWIGLLGLPPVNTHALRFSPDFAHDRTLFSAPFQHGVRKSVDGGLSWLDVSGPMAGLDARAFEVSPAFASDRTLMAGTIGHGVYESNDAGQSWTKLAGVPADGVVESLAFSPEFATDGTVFVATLGDGVFRSTDGGDTWTPQNVGLPLDAKRVIRVSPDFANDQTVYVTSHAWIHRSHDAGVTWSPLPGWIRIDDRHPSVVHSGTWATAWNALDFGGEVKRSTEPGAVERYDFSGDGITWFARKGPSAGSAVVFVDGVAVALVFLQAPTEEHRIPVFSKSFPTVGWHRIEVMVAGRGGGAVASDGFAVTF